MKKISVIIIALSMAFVAFKVDKPAYLLFDKAGKQAAYADMISAMNSADIVFFGELHTDPIAHWLELEITKDLYANKGENLVLAAEMFETDNQLLIDEYLADAYDAKKFEAEVKLWGNYQTDYKPLVEFAKENKLNFVASNIPRRYASVVHKNGFEGLDSLSDEAKKLFAPLPFKYDASVKCYADMMSMQGMGGHVNENFPKAQAAKDVTMAHFILKNWSKGKQVIHYNGSYHSTNFEGIIWYLLQENPDLKIVTVETVYQDKIDVVEEENIGIANYVICVPSNMTQTKR